MNEENQRFTKVTILAIIGAIILIIIVAAFALNKSKGAEQRTMICYLNCGRS